MSIENNTTETKSILCIPGRWKKQTDIVTSIISSNKGEFILAGEILLNLKTQATFELEICERDVNMRNAFKSAGKVNGLDDEFLDLIDKHTFVIYIVGPGGSLGNAKAIADAGLAIINAGGLGMKIETGGKAFTREQWIEFFDDQDEADLYKMFVIDSIRDEDGTVFSCGMHNLGLKDTIVSGEDFQQAVDLISTFGYYQIVDKPLISDGQTFAESAESPVFTIMEEINQPYGDDDLFGNPFGMWRLIRK